MIPKIEQGNPAEIVAVQEAGLREAITHAATNSAYYERLFNEAGIDASLIQGLDDLKRIPVTTKDVLQAQNDEFICVPREKIMDYSTTSGTLGQPVTLPLTDNDLERLAYNEAISFACAGMQKGDVAQLMTTMDRRFMAGLAYFLGTRKLGAGIIRVGAGIPELQWDSISKFQPTHLIAVPSFLLKMIEYAKQNGIDPNASSVHSVICIGEPIRNQDFSLNTLSQKIKKDWDVDLFSTYASTEMSTAFTECSEKQGGHLHPELIITEILDENNQEVPQGEVGELTITTLGVEAMPLIRFKTGDMVKAHYEPCACGRTTLRLGPVVGRRKQMIKYKGTTLYPPAMMDLMNDFHEIELYIIEVFQNDYGTDEILIKMASSDKSEELMHRIKDHFRAKLRVLPKIELHEADHIHSLRNPAMQRKPVQFIDRRE